MKQILLLLILISFLNAQTYEDWLIEQESKYTIYKKTFDEEFAQSLKEDWYQFRSLYHHNPYQVNKPLLLPSIIKEKALKTNEIKKSKVLKLKKIIPIEKEKEKIIIRNFKNSILVNFSFYSKNINITYNKNNDIHFIKYSKENISKFWKNISSNNYQNTLKQLIDYSNHLNLNDWAKYLLIYNTGLEIYKNKNMANLFTWFYLIKMNYDVKVGFNNNSIYLLSTINHKLFQVSFFILNNKKYYVLNPNGKSNKIESIFTYKKSYDKAVNKLSFENKKTIKFNTNIQKKYLTFVYLKKTYSIQTSYSLDLIKFYSTFPQSDYQVYFNSYKSNLLNITLLSGLRKVIKGKTEIEAVNLILRFVQTAFKYKTDLDNFSYEKVLFPEETIHYKYSDCEDRSIMFSYLIKNLTTLNIVAIKYENHLASAVSFNSQIEGSSFMYKNKKYLISDATYINANVGMTMPKFKNSRFEIIHIK